MEAAWRRVEHDGLLISLVVSACAVVVSFGFFSEGTVDLEFIRISDECTQESSSTVVTSVRVIVLLVFVV